MTTTISDEELRAVLDEATPEPTPTPPAEPEPDDKLTPAVRQMVGELDAEYQGTDVPSISKLMERMKDTTGSKSWDSRGQVDKARQAYRAKHGIEATNPAAKKPAVRTAPAKPRRTVVRPPAPEAVRTATDPTPVPPPPTVVRPQPAEAVRTAPARPVVWPIILLAAPAFVAIWGGWVGLGGLTGFGKVNLLPGIGNGFTIDSAITLPIGVETYGAYALYVWLSGRVPERALRFAKWSAMASLFVGALGQVVYHLLAAADATKAPWPVTTAVACLPVAVLGMGAALAHLVREEH